MDVVEDMRKMGFQNWWMASRDCEPCKKVLGEAKARSGLYSAAADEGSLIVKSMRNFEVIFTGSVCSPLFQCFSFPSLLQREALYEMYSRTTIETVRFTSTCPLTLCI